MAKPKVDKKVYVGDISCFGCKPPAISAAKVYEHDPRATPPNLYMDCPKDKGHNRELHPSWRPKVMKEE